MCSLTVFSLSLNVRISKILILIIFSVGGRYSPLPIFVPSLYCSLINVDICQWVQWETLADYYFIYQLL